jgi:regulator of RNase E activity RraB
MIKNFPNDDDGDVLKGLQAKGVDLSQPRKIEYYCYAENEPVAVKIASKIEDFGYHCDVFHDENASSRDKAYSVYCARVMVPSYDAIIRAQAELNSALSSFNTSCDGWGTPVE